MAFLIFPPLVILIAEIIYFLIVAGLSFGIFYKTRDIYKLSRHSGVFHFRNIFLYFSMAYFFVLFMVSVQLYSWLPLMRLFYINMLVILLFGYFSTMAILSIGATVLIRNIKMSNSSLNNLLHFIAIITSVFTVMTGSTEILILLQILILLGSLFVVLIRNRQRKLPSLTQNRITYFLLLVFWVASVLAMSRGFFFSVKIGLYAFSSLVFLWIYLRVKKRLVIHAKEKGKAGNHK
jgi:hypothetical protein